MGQGDSEGAGRIAMPFAQQRAATRDSARDRDSADRFQRAVTRRTTRDGARTERSSTRPGTTGTAYERLVPYSFASAINVPATAR